jgi:hypothetical protein
MIIVLSNGELFEIGAPHDLLMKYLPCPSTSNDFPPVDEEEKSIPKASFASLVLQTGADMSLKLRKMAFQAKQRATNPNMK